MVEKPKYLDTKTGRVVKAIIVESIHDWKKLQKHTGFSDKELNYHLSRLYNDNVIVRKNKEYHIVPELEKQYQRYYQQNHVKQKKNKATSKSKKVINVRSTLLIAILFLSIIANIHYASTLNQVRTENNQLYNEIDYLTSTVNQLQNTITDYESTINSLMIRLSTSMTR